MNKKALRRQMRQRRQQLSQSQQRTAAIEIAARISLLSHHYARGPWALYLSSDGEIDLNVLHKKLSVRKFQCYLPVLHPIYHNRLWFIRYDHSTRLIRNKYGIFEPSLRKAKRIPTWALTVVCLPLVAFDSLGNRLGMGGGYYDRSFANNKLAIKRPALIGTAHHFQEAKSLTSEQWDIPLDAVATDKNVFRFKLKR